MASDKVMSEHRRLMILDLNNELTRVNAALSRAEKEAEGLRGKLRLACLIANQASPAYTPPSHSELLFSACFNAGISPYSQLDDQVSGEDDDAMREALLAERIYGEGR